MESKDLLVCSAQRQRRRSNLKSEPIVPYEFKSNLKQKKLDEIPFNPVKRKMCRTNQGQKSVFQHNRVKAASGFKGTRVLRSKHSCENLHSNSLEVIDQYAKRTVNFGQYEPYSIRSRIRFAYNLSLYERRYNPDQQKQSKQNIDKNHLFDCLIKKMKTEWKQSDYKFDIQSIPATIQPRVISNKL